MYLVPQLHLFFSADPSIGKIDTASMPHQTLLELLISNFDDKSVFRDTENYFTEITHWEGVTVNEHQEVTAIQWERDLNYELDCENDAMNDKLPQHGGSVDLKWTPSTLRYLNISYLSLRGTIDTFDLPRELLHLNISFNAFEGTFATSGLPIDLTLICAENNNLAGTLDFSMLPPSLERLMLSRNAFSGTINFANLPIFLDTMSLSRNQFTGDINLQGLPQSVKIWQLEKNHFNMQKSITVRKGAISYFILDKGEIEEVVNTDGKPLNFVLQHGFIRVTRNTYPILQGAL